MRQKGKRHITSTRWWQFLLSSLFTIHCSLFTVSAQESQTAYNFLRLPVSAHVSALGGENITIPDDDATMIFHNPSLINFVSDKTINLNYMTYMEGAKTASAAFVKAAGERASWGVMAQYMDCLCAHRIHIRRYYGKGDIIEYCRLSLFGSRSRLGTELY